MLLYKFKTIAGYTQRSQEMTVQHGNCRNIVRSTQTLPKSSLVMKASHSKTENGRLLDHKKTILAVKLLSRIPKWWIHNIPVFKPIEWTTPRVNPKINHGLWVIMMCQRRFISGNKCTIWWGMWTMGKSYSVQATSVRPLSFVH